MDDNAFKKDIEVESVEDLDDNTFKKDVEVESVEEESSPLIYSDSLDDNPFKKDDECFTKLDPR